jgi:iron complex outermembrane receptor protein
MNGAPFEDIERLMRSSLIATVALTLCVADVAAAQAPKDTAKALPGVTTTATRNPASTLDVPLATTQVPTADLRNRVGYGLEDALRLVPGVIAQSRYGTSDVRLIIRGFGARGAGDRSNSGTSRGVRVLLDGFPETEPDGRTAFDNIDLGTAYGVDVVRSSASSLWGNAAGGVVNVSSRPTTATNAVEVQPMMGAFGMKRIATRTSASLGESGMIWGSFTNTSVDGWREHSDARRAVVNLGASGSVSEHTRLGIYLVGANNIMKIPGPLTQAQMDSARNMANPTYKSRDEKRYNRLARLGLSVDHDLNATTSISSQFYVNPKYLQRSERNTYRDFTRYHLGGNVVARKSMDIGSMKHRFTAGVDQAVQDGSIQFYALSLPTVTRGALSDNKGEGAFNSGAFLQDELTVNNKLSLLLGGRYDRVSYNYRTFFNPAATLKSQSVDYTRVSPKLGFTWKVGSTGAVYANMGGGVEVPAGNETDQSPTGPVPGALLNPLLDPIISNSYEAGFKQAGMSMMDGALLLGYDVALYDIEVQNEIIPYNGGRYYQTAAEASRRGVELSVNANTSAGIFARAALTLNNHTYGKYIVDSTVISATTTGQVDLSGNQVMGVPKTMATVELGTEVPFYRNLVIRGSLEHFGEYFADDANTVAATVPSYMIFGLRAELKEPILKTMGVGVRGFVTVHNLTDTKYVGSAFLNPDLVGGVPALFEPGMPRAVTFSFTLGRM